MEYAAYFRLSTTEIGALGSFYGDDNRDPNCRAEQIRPSAAVDTGRGRSRTALETWTRVGWVGWVWLNVNLTDPTDLTHATHPTLPRMCTSR